MSGFEVRHVEIHVFRRPLSKSAKTPSGIEFLLLRRAAGQPLPGIWQPITGSLRRGEAAWRGAVREVREETGLTPHRWWALEHLVAFYEPHTDRLEALPIFLAEVGPSDLVTRSREHDAHQFLPPARAGKTVHWQAQRDAMEAIDREVFLHPSFRPTSKVTHPRDITTLIHSTRRKR
ncbi:MAG: NUDIX domain-containing protein [Candidatus Eisenbacteria bacterium]|uniref:NUDIX domain-containing protein n=1 Tax=Eiseniibacteriota bacterium TaxID=2212470 RepID=A0A849SKV9_UNCEI|nr:NUDIX domain-containing protein [Candidatus Eisenbacteria bacterium]